MIPSFAVVGHPNKGKSSIVSTLSEDAQVEISAIAGTTTRSRRYPMRVDEQVLYELIDTPGFQRPRQVLAWFESHASGTHARAAVVADFVASHVGQARFKDECELLGPLLEGAGILYVVDGAKPYGPEYEAEMQILRWTGRPRMALINTIGSAEFVQQWRSALDQYFAIVRVFDAMQADFDKRLALLRGFAELDESWREPLREAVHLLEADRETRRRRSAAEIADLLLAGLTLRKSCALVEDETLGELPAQAEARLLEKLLDELRDRESRVRKRIEAIYNHHALTRVEDRDSLLATDVFCAQSWQAFGLTRRELLAAGAASGAVAGGGVDLALGGASMLLGAGLGAMIGAAGALIGADRLARVEVLGTKMGGRMLTVGPIQDPGFPWVIIGRARLHHRLVSERNHARRESLIVDHSQGRDLPLNPQNRRAIDRILADISRRGQVDSQTREHLTDAIQAVLAR